jgi:hypothetical protein
MRVLTTTAGELATVCGPTCGWDGCPCWRHGVALESGLPIDDGLVVAERDGFTIDDYRTTCAGFLERKGLADEDGEYAALMADEAAWIASESEIGDRLWPQYITEDDESGERQRYDERPDDDQDVEPVDDPLAEVSA